jgi:secondary thiamine-phosphate synthase enzyme
MKIYRETLQLKTKGAFDIIDVTSDVEKALVNSGIEEGYALVYSRHTTCGVLLNERETGLLGDLEQVLGRLVPQGDYYKHDDWEIRTENMHPDETPNAHSHLRQVVGGRISEYVPVFDAALMLGEWQRIMILELDQAKEREILIQVCGV